MHYNAPSSQRLMSFLFIVYEAKLLDWGEDGFMTETEISTQREAFRKEVAVWKELNHRNVARVNIFLLIVHPHTVLQMFNVSSFLGW